METQILKDDAMDKLSIIQEPQLIYPPSDTETYSIVVAAGPYTFTDSLSYLPLKTLLSFVEIR